MRILLYAIFAFLCSCSPRMALKSERCFKSKLNPVYGGQSVFCIQPDSSFAYYGSGPSFFLSKGRWQYDGDRNEILLSTYNDLKPAFKNPIDTMWVDLTQKRIKVLSKKKIVFENIIYYAQ
ncbi:hypothetical protein ACFSQD_12615 [Flavihumibacter stibioxidans]|uniref:Uncharacterized protein n=1 Tax=Flavihumibacter stibioxidans TaxID=1834163 RepID=A0ABR7MEZ1_9BACT|nr:hypothetical protein [Flavihumibacter stibioxidans]MBC6493206.1 hypothetical protein [Flavihumibacter stibioxidans]